MVALFVAYGLALSARAAKPVWAGGSGDGNNSQNWDHAPTPPGQSDVAHVGKGTATYDSPNTSIGALELTKDADATEPGKIGGSGKVTFLGGTNLASTWDAGEMSFTSSGGVIFDTTASFTIQTSNSHKLSGGSLTNKGNTSWTGGSIDVSGGATITNDLSGLFTVSFDGTLTNAGSAIFSNAGTFKKTAGSGTQTDIQAAFQNTGLVKVDAGKLKLSGGGSSSGTSSSTTNVVDVADGATLQIATLGYTFTGTTLTASGTNKIGIVDLNGATATFSGTSGSANVSVTGGGVASFTGSHTGSGKLTVSNGTISGGGAATFGGLDWTAGEINSKVTATGNAASVSGPGTKTIGSSGELTIAGGTTIAPSTWTGNVSNAGKLTHASGETDIQSSFSSSGTNASVSVTGGTLKLSGGGSSSGSVAVGNGAKLQIASNNYTFDTTAFSGSGTVELAGATTTFKGATGNAKVSVNASGAVAEFDTSASTLDTLTLGSGSVSSTNNGSASVSSLQWNGGTLNAKITSAGSTFDATAKNLGASADLTLSGNTSWAGGTISGNTTAKIRNEAAKTFNATADGTLTGGTFTNAGIFTKSGGTTTSTDIQGRFDSTGTVNANAGTLKLSGGGSSTGSVTIGDSASLSIAAGTYEFGGGSLTGNVGSGQRGKLSVASGGTATFTGTMTGNTADYEVAGTANFNTAHATTGKLSVSGGTVGGTEQVTVGGLDFLGGTVSGKVRSSGTVALRGGTKAIDGGELTLAGNSTWSEGPINASGAAHIKNDTAATFTASGSGTLANSGGATFTNAGTFEKTGAGSSTTIQAALRNEKNIFVRSGSLILSGGAHNVAGGAIDVGDGAELHLSGGVTLEADPANGSMLKGQGLARMLSGSLDANGLIDISRFNFEGGQLTGTQSFAGTVNWKGGNWNALAAGSTTTIATGILNLVHPTSNDFNQRSLVNEGTVNWHSGSLQAGNGSSFKNKKDFFDLNSANAVVAAEFGGTFTFSNTGTYHKSGAGTTRVEIDFTNDGTVNVTGGTLVFAGGFTNNGGLHLLNGAAAEFASPFSFGPGEVLSGTGTIRAPQVTAAGPVSPGVSPGSLTITGNLTLLSTSTLLIELGGLVPGTSYDVLNVGGTAQLDGTLSVGFVNGFNYWTQIAPATTFTVLNAASLTGSFGNIANGQRLSFTDGGVSLSFQVNYGPGSVFPTLANSVVLSNFVAVPEPSTWTLLGLGAVMLIFQFHRRRR